MGKAAVAGELAGAGELDELYRLNASETEPEDDEGEEEDDEHEGFEPEEMQQP